jgi:hypothetical protein
MSWFQNVALSAGLALDGECVSYLKHENPDVSIELEAVGGQTTFREQGTQLNGARILRSRDFLFEADCFRSVVGRWPEDGDKILYTPPISDLESVTFRVTPVNGEPVYRLDPHYTQLRIHTHEFAETAL